MRRNRWQRWQARAMQSHGGDFGESARSKQARSEESAKLDQAHSSSGTADTPPRRGVPRRTVVVGTGALTAAGVLAACAPQSSSQPESAESAKTAASVEVPVQSVALAATADIPIGSGLRVPQRELVIVQPQEGQFFAYGERCPHAGCAVATFTDAEIRCPCHGSAFSTTTGDVLRGPATSGLYPIAVEVDGDQIVTAIQ